MRCTGRKIDGRAAVAARLLGQARYNATYACVYIYMCVSTSGRSRAKSGLLGRAVAAIPAAADIAVVRAGLVALRVSCTDHLTEVT